MKIMRTTKYFSAILIFTLNLLFSQMTDCKTGKSEYVDQITVDKDDLICLSKNSDKQNTVFFTFASWCKPCRIHLPDAIKLEKVNNVDVYVLLVDVEDGDRIKKTINYVRSIDADVKIVVLKNSVYGNSLYKRNRKFVEAITPKNMEAIDDFSKFILISKNGDVKYVTNWKDYDKDWENSQSMLNKKIIPLLE